MATYLTKAQLARLALARLRVLAPNETLASEDQTTAELEIDIAKSRLESSIFNGVTLWTNDNAIPIVIVEGFLLNLLPFLAANYQVAVPTEMINEGYRELCRQLTKAYNPDTLAEEETTAGTVLLLDAATATGYGTASAEFTAPITFQAWITGTTGTVAATVVIYGSNDTTVLTSPTVAAKTTLFTSSTLTGTGVGVGTAVATESFICNTSYQYYIAQVSAISGTGTTVSVSGG